MAIDIFSRFNTTRDWSLGAAMYKLPSKKRRAKWAESVAQAEAEKKAPPPHSKPKIPILLFGFTAAIASLILFPPAKR